MSSPRHKLPDPDRAGTHACILVGPTATGKSGVAQCIAERWGLGILSADSMLVYRGMDLGTAKPSAGERGAVPYWGIDLVSPADPFSVGAYLEHAAGAFRSAAAAARPLIVAGGTGLYVNALLQGLAGTERPAPAIRDQVRAWFDAEGRDGLAHRLRELAPARYATLADPQNPRRLMRALELHLGGGQAPAGWDPASLPRIVGLHRERTALAARIQDRVGQMYHQGLLDEAARLRREFPEISLTAREAIGYAEAFAVLDGTMSPEQAMERTAIRTRQLAKRQVTWFRRKLNVAWIEVGLEDAPDQLAERVIAEWERVGPAPVRVETDYGEQ